MTVYALFNRRVTIFGIPENIGVRSFFFLGKSRVSHPEFAAVNMPHSEIHDRKNIQYNVYGSAHKKPLKIDFLACYAEQLSGKVKP